MFILSVLLMASGCRLPADRFHIKDQVLQGTYADEAFSFVSGYAMTSQLNPESWIVWLYNKLPQAGMDPWDSGAYDGYSDLVSVVFLLGRDSTAKSYLVEITASHGVSSIILIGISSTGCTDYFHEGVLSVTDINHTAGTISGGMDAHSDNMCGKGEVNGTFTVPIEPNSL
jgi:hypothetical protein